MVLIRSGKKDCEDRRQMMMMMMMMMMTLKLFNNSNCLEKKSHDANGNSSFSSSVLSHPFALLNSSENFTP